MAEAAYDEPPVVPVFFLSDSTGISAETMGNALLIQFPDARFERTLIPFITTVEEARRVVAILDEAMDGPVTPLVFTTAAVDDGPPRAGEDPGADHRLLRAAHEPGRGDPRHAAGCTRPPGCTASATSAATTAGWRRSSSPSSTTTARACAPSRRPT